MRRRHRGLGLALLLSLLPAGAAAIQQGDRSVAVCVVAPRVEPVEEADALGVVPTPRPRLVVVEPLLEIRIQRQGHPTWSREGTRDQPILTPLDWPAPPIQPGELVLLQLRPLEASSESFAHVQLAGASQGRMESTAALIRSLGQRGEAWLAAFEQALDRGDVPLAWALLFHPSTPATAELISLQQEVIRRGCSG
jgi:hypothetical protein